MTHIVTHDRQEWMDATYLLGIEPKLADAMYPRLGHMDFILLGDTKIFTIKYKTVAKNIGRVLYHPFREILAKWREYRNPTPLEKTVRAIMRKQGIRI
jgi:hypothetical protein